MVLCTTLQVVIVAWGDTEPSCLPSFVRLSACPSFPSGHRASRRMIPVFFPVQLVLTSSCLPPPSLGEKEPFHLSSPSLINNRLLSLGPPSIACNKQTARVLTACWNKQTKENNPILPQASLAPVSPPSSSRVRSIHLWPVFHACSPQAQFQWPYAMSLAASGKRKNRRKKIRTPTISCKTQFARVLFYSLYPNGQWKEGDSRPWASSSFIVLCPSPANQQVHVRGGGCLLSLISASFFFCLLEKRDRAGDRVKGNLA